MKIITFYSDTHYSIYSGFFLDSYKKYLSHHELISKKVSQISPTGEYESEGFDLMMLEKVNLILENIDLLDDNPFLYTDCDVQFFGNLEFEIDNYDILFQNDFTSNNHCAGFFIAKQNQKVFDFFYEVKKRLMNSIGSKTHDQTIINNLFEEGYDKISKNMLPYKKYWTVAFSTNGAIWSGQEILVPDEIIAHHANFTIGINNKLELLKRVKEIKNI